jgi:hypothetical protein
MKYQALTLKAPGIIRSILIPVVASQSKTLCDKFKRKKTEADVLALIDTEATNTSISNKLAASLGLKVIEQCEVEAAGGIHIANIYMIDVLLRDMVEFLNIRSAEFIANDKFDIIIGMDILTKGDLAITNHDNRTVLSFRVPPDMAHIDFVESKD